MIKLLKSILILCLLFVYTSASTQSEKQKHYIDSLETELKTSVDTSKVIILVNLSVRTSKFEFDKSHKYAIQALRLSNRLKYKKGKGDALQSIATYYKRTNNDSLAIVYYEKSLNVKQEISDSLGMSRTYNNLGLIYFNIGDFQKAVDFYSLALKIKQNLKFTDTDIKIKERNKKRNDRGIGISYNNIGNVYIRWGKYEEALKFYQKAERIFIELDFPQGLSSTSNNMGLIYDNLAQFTDTIRLNKALSLFKQGLKVNKELNNPYGIIEGHNNIGNVYLQLANFHSELTEKDTIINSLDSITKMHYITKADNYYSKSLESYNEWLNITKEINFEQGNAQALLAIGTLYNNTKDWKNAKKYLQESLSKLLVVNDKHNQAICYNYLGSTYLQTKEHAKALKYLEKSKVLANEMGVKKVNIDNYALLSQVYEKENDYKNALIYFKTYIGKKDSLFSEKSDKILQELQTKYETEKKETEINLLNKDKELQDSQIKQQRMIIFGFIIVVIIISVFAFFIFRLFSQKKKANILLSEQKKEITSKNDELNQQNVEISAQRDEIETQRDNVEKQKHIIEEIHSEVTQSIQYAKRIQSAILPQEKDISDFKNNKFIYFRPRDIVSGDFYWIKEYKDNTIYVAADCTGHGVPGAFMSMLGVTFLNEIVNRKDINKASLVLDALRASVIKSLHQTGAEGEQKDGMDLALIAINNKKSILEFAGANNPMYLVRKDETLIVNEETLEPILSQGDYNLFEVKADKMPIGIHLKGNIPFKNNIVKVNKADKIYIFSDGYPDQFGGPKGKKFMYKPFKKLLLGMQEESMQTQEAILDKAFLDWQGKLEQIDDVIIIGIEI